MLMLSRAIVSLFFGVILTTRRAVFMSGETDAMVPETMLPNVVSLENCILGSFHGVWASER